jgi:tRNA(Glu) U13 pseudouridine synthase TruD
MIAEGFRVEEPEPDEQQTKARRFKVTTTFSLPRGGYATVLLRALGQ